MTEIIEKRTHSNQTKSATLVDTNPLNLAASWYVAMLSKELGKKPKAIQLFGRDLVAWRDGNGNPVIMERYCSHMGASLAIGEVKDGCIQCPFHHWHYDNKGDCVSIPDIEHIPPTARQATYVTQERYGFIWVWYGTSSPLFPLPEFLAAEDEKHNYMPWYFTLNTKTTVKQVLENISDYSHIAALHHFPQTSIQLTCLDEQESPPEFQPLIEKQAWYGTLIEAKAKRYVGPMGAILQVFGFHVSTWTLQVNNWPSGFIAKSFINGHERFTPLIGLTPIAENKTTWHMLTMVKKTGFFLTDIIAYLVLGWQNNISVAEDQPVFDTIKPDAGRVHVKHDHGVLKFKRFYQKWVNKVEVFSRTNL